MIVYNSPFAIYKIPASDYKLLADSESEISQTGGEVSLSEVKESIDLTNHILVGIIFFLGLIFGIIGLRIFFDKVRAD